MGATLFQLDPSPQPVIPSSVPGQHEVDLGNLRQGVPLQLQDVGRDLLDSEGVGIGSRLVQHGIVCMPVHALTALIPRPTATPPPSMPAAMARRKSRRRSVASLLGIMIVIFPSTAASPSTAGTALVQLFRPSARLAVRTGAGLSKVEEHFADL